MCTYLDRTDGRLIYRMTPELSVRSNWTSLVADIDQQTGTDKKRVLPWTALQAGIGHRSNTGASYLESIGSGMRHR